VQTDLLIKGGNIFDCDTGTIVKQDLLIKSGKIEAIDKTGSFSTVDVQSQIDACNCLVTPGLIDIHVHLREPGQEWKETISSGSKAAIAGGFTSICCMPNTTPTNHSAEITRFIIEKAKSAGYAKVYPIGAVSLKLESEQMAPLAEMREAGCVAFSDDGKPVSNAGLMRRALEWAASLGCPIFGHEEELTLSTKGVMNESPLSYKLGLSAWPKLAEEVMISRDIELSRVTGAHVHFLHVTTARGVELIRRAKSDGVNVSAEVCPHHLFFTQEEIKNYDTAYKMSPPLREQEDIEALLAGLNDGTIDCITTDHAPHDIDTKRVEFDQASFGLIGLQSAFPLVLRLVNDKKISMATAIRSLTSNPAKVLNRPDLGSLKKSSTADISIFNLESEWQYNAESILSLSKNTPWLDHNFKGRARDVIVDGKIILQNHNFLKIS
jgi:dihydroorotase